MTESEASTALQAILEHLGVKAGDRLMLGIDMGALPLPRYSAALDRQAFRERERKWCTFVLDILKSAVGPSGTILVPTYTYSCGSARSCFVLEDTRSEVGPFTEFVRTQAGVVRSVHPIFSLSGIGRDAASILLGTGRSAFGAVSPFGRFHSYGVRFLCLGVELRKSITYIHHLEQSYGCPHRYNKVFDVDVLSGGKKIPGPWYAYVGFRMGYESEISALQKALKEAGALAECNWNGHANHLADIRAVDLVGYDLLSKNSDVFVNQGLDMRFEEAYPNTDLQTGAQCNLTVYAKEKHR